MKYLNWAGYVAIPLAFGVHLGFRGRSWEPVATFLLAALGVLPLAHLMGEATEHLSEKTGPTWGGLLNATFGNAAELIIAIIALTKGLTGIVQASLTGSILGNLLLVAGAAMVVGGWRREKQVFNKSAAEANSGLLAISVAALLFPAIFHYTATALHDVQLTQHENAISVGTSIILLFVYAMGLLFTLRTHAHIFSPKPHHAPASGANPHSHGETWSVKRSVVMLLIAAAGVGVVAELLVGSAEKVAENLGWNHIFVGVILLAIIGNAAEHSTAIMLANRDDMDTAMTITYQSSVQIALFVTPFLVLLSFLLPHLGFDKARPLTLMFSSMEIIAVMLTVFVVVILGINGETNWFEGVVLLALYAILGIAFFYIPSAHGDAHNGAQPAATQQSPPAMVVH